MKRLLLTIVFILILLPNAIGTEFWGSKKLLKYHYPDCERAQMITPENLVIFTSPADAINAGYGPCNVCKPPITN